MNPQVRRLFALVLGLFVMLGAAVTYVQFVKAPDLVSDPRNTRQYIQLAERDRGPIIVAGTPVAVSQRQDNRDSYRRSYPQGPLYASVTGYFSAVTLNATGLEAAENDILIGDSSNLLWQRMRNLFAGKPRQGGGVELTLDPSLQQAAADALGNTPGAVVALDVETGAVRALYSSPTYDPNVLASTDGETASTAIEELESAPTRPLDNRAIASTRYAPGSVFKILTTAALLENGYKPSTKMDAPRTATLPNTDTTVSNYGNEKCGDGEPTLTEAFARSCNTAYVLASEDLTETDLEAVTDRFGFGQNLAIPLPVTPSRFPSDLDQAQLAMSSIGQFDVQVTPMQMAAVTQAVANDGRMMRPYLVDRVVDADNQTRETTSPTKWSNPISAEVAQDLTEMMVAAVSEPYGTATAANSPHFQVAAKTGTAEIGDGSRSNAWTVAFAPADDPQLAVVVLVEATDENPQPTGGGNAAPIARILLETGVE